jgi:hypothetical protein
MDGFFVKRWAIRIKLFYTSFVVLKEEIVYFLESDTEKSQSGKMRFETMPCTSFVTSQAI